MLPMNYSSPVSLVAGCGSLIDQIDFLQLVERFAVQIPAFQEFVGGHLRSRHLRVKHWQKAVS